MNDREDRLASESMPPLMRRPMESSRVGAYTALGALAGLVPLPWVPDVSAKRIRGAMVHDIAVRHGLSLTDEARRILEEPWDSNLPKGFLMQTARFAVGRVLSTLGPLGWLGPVRSALAIFALSHLFTRYLTHTRTLRAARIDAEEARLFRKAMDKSLVLLVTLESKSPWRDTPRGAEDLRDSRTQMIDGFILSAASLPGWLVERLETAFDEALAGISP
jgi:hypothetical protein